MSFPISPVDGQVYKDKIYNSILGVWKKSKLDFIEIWGPGKGNSPAIATNQGEVGPGRYLIEVRHSPDSTETMSGIAVRTQLDINGGASSYTMRWSNDASSGNAVGARILPSGVVTTNSGVYTGGIYRVSRWQEAEL